MPIKTWFPTSIYYEPLKESGLKSFNESLLEDCLLIRNHDKAGVRWSRDHYVGGYTSYHSISNLHQRSSTFISLAELISRHVRAFAKHLQFDLRGRTLSITDCWLNIMPAHTTHSLHIHPLSTISGTYYVQTPKNSAAIKFEDPRLTRFMAAPPRLPHPKSINQTFVSYPAKAGHLVLFESWLGHEVPASTNSEDRISISFNYHWA